MFVGMRGVKTVMTPKNDVSSAQTAAPSASPIVLQTPAPTSITNKKIFQQFFEVQGLVIQSKSNLDVLFSNGESV